MSAGIALAAAAARTDTLPDPMRPDYLHRPGHATPVTPGWLVSSIIISPHRRLARVNGKVVKPGDTVHGARVLEILPYAVKLEGKHGAFMAYLLTADIKHPFADTHGN